MFCILGVLLEARVAALLFVSDPVVTVSGLLNLLRKTD